jgi:N4-(beta-N-acetylglucosaminyl)-L-asparaginase
MEYTDHVLLMGEGALRFAVAMGFEQEDLLTPRAREMWMKWKRSLSPKDDWIDPSERLAKGLSSLDKQKLGAMLRDHGTINCNAVNEKGEISGVTTTSGLAYKIPGRVGDSPIIGAGLYVDNEVGACGSTGRGEANLKTCASFLAVEFMRDGASPEEAGLRALKRIAENTKEPYLLDDQGRPNFNVKFYALNKKGQFAGTAIWSADGREGGRLSRARYAANDGESSKIYESAYLYKR